MKGDIEAARKIIGQYSSFPAVCGRVCPQEKQCEANCVRGIKGESVAIGKLERFVADNAKNEEIVIESKNGKKVAVVGSGPAGLTCAGELAKKGYDVTVFEALHTPGGVLMYGIPEFRLPKKIVLDEIDNLKKIGVKIETNMVIGKITTIDELVEEEGFEAIFIGSGAGLPRFMDIPGEGYNGVLSANEFLTRINLMKAYRSESDTPIKTGKKIAVVGGGNVAMDAARCAKRMNVDEVYIIYRRGIDEMPARAEEIHHAKDEGIIFKPLTNPIEIIGDENHNVKGIKCVEMVLGEIDESGRRSPVVKEDSEFIIDVDTVIMAIGNHPNPLIKDTHNDILINKRGCFIVNEDGLTSKEAVYAGGDAVTGAATVILAMGAGKKSAQAIDNYLLNK